MMSDEDYLATQSQLLALGRIVGDMDLGGFLERARHAEAVAPILDPTLFMRAGENLRDIINLASALKPFKTEVEKHRPIGESAVSRNAHTMSHIIDAHKFIKDHFDEGGEND